MKKTKTRHSMLSNILLGLLGTIAISSTALANQFVQMKNIEVHYVAFNSTFLTPQIAQQYQLQRNPNLAIINISILDSSKLGKPAISATLNGQARNLIGQIKPLTFKEFKQGDAIYYLAQLPFNNQDKFDFKIDVNSGLSGSGILRFQQTLYSQ